MQEKPQWVSLTGNQTGDLLVCRKCSAHGVTLVRAHLPGFLVVEKLGKPRSSLPNGGLLKTEDHSNL